VFFIGLNNLRQKFSLIHAPVPVGEDFHFDESTKAVVLYLSPDGRNIDASFPHEPPIV